MNAVRLPRVAVVGRQNVGKSTLLNRLHGKRQAIAHPLAGVTRDRLEVEAAWRGRVFLLIDTGGYVRDAAGIEALVTEQAARAASDADVVLLVCDGRTGIQEEDEDLARRLRRAAQPVLLVANKVDSAADEAGAADFYRLGLGEPAVVSALHGRGSGDLLDRLVDLLPPTADAPEAEGEPRFALVGRPNVGKSSLFNRLVGEERSVVFEEAGTTRDAVDALIRWESGPVRFVDTAGLRRASKAKGVEFFSLLRTRQAIERSHVALLVIDAADGLTQEDKRIASEVLEAGRGLVIAANKWDLIDEKDALYKEFREGVDVFAHAPLLRTSALSAAGVKRVAPALVSTHASWVRRVPTARVNEVLADALGGRPPPRAVGRYHYATQVASRPPTFVVFGGKPPDAAYRRFLENRFRRAFRFDGVPVRLKFRARRRKA